MYVMVFWSGARGHHDYKLVPWPIEKLDEHPEYWPDEVGRFWLQAKRSLRDENWDAAAIMARSALQASLREQKAEVGSLKREIDDLSEKGVLPNIVKDWSHNVRELGNESAHPQPGQKPTDPQDASDIVKFMDYLFEYLYTLPKQIKEYRERKDA